MSKKCKKVFDLKVDDLFHDREHSSVDIKNLTVREFSIIAYALRHYVSRYGSVGPERDVSIEIMNLSKVFDDAEIDLDLFFFKNERGAYHG